ncbi:unnamed protein product [Mesocestoides corti]|uniref:Membrane associated ring-CH-type finger 10 n=1 Tax=Mesocestoides corti TaxID=53468 RepID=A0A0R3U9H1_MESCO|nr:unnamed protein product [Mesocestoides corti]
MSQHKRGSHDSLSPEECERLVLSPPPVAFNPEKLKEFVSVNRALSAKRSLHSVNTNESTPVLPRHASIAWSHSEFDSKFKRYESELKSAVVPGGPQESDLKRNYQVSLNTAEKETSSSPVADSSEHAEDVSSTQLKKSGSIVRGKSSWKRLLCCVSAHTPIPEEQNRNILRPVSSRGESVQFAEDAPEVSTKITKSSKLSSLFKKKHRNGGPSPSPVKLRSVHKSPQIADERLKTPAPTLLVTRHNDPTVINETNHTHIEENGVAGCHLNVDDRISESTNSRDSIRSDDSYLGPIDQVSF